MRQVETAKPYIITGLNGDLGPLPSRPIWSETANGGHFRTEPILGTAWTWGLHADAHDFPGQLMPNGKVTARIFAAHFGHLSIVSATFILGARFSNFESWVADPSSRPVAQGVWASRSLLQESINHEDIGATSGVFQVWRQCGITTNDELFTGAIS